MRVTGHPASSEIGGHFARGSSDLAQQHLMAGLIFIFNFEDEVILRVLV